MSTGAISDQSTSAASVFDLESLRKTPLSRDPYEHVIVSSFVQPEALRAINEDYPAIEQGGSFPLASVTFGPGFQVMVDALESDEFRKAFEEKFQIDLAGRPTTITVRKRCTTRDGHIHTDSLSKIITILLYMNPAWDDSGGRGRLRLLRSNNLDDFAAEVPPSGGSLVAFLRSDHSWHGHLPFIGERRVIQFNWVTDNESQRFTIFRHRLSASVKQMLSFGKPSKTPEPEDPSRM
jgi:SM-20-related protein